MAWKCRKNQRFKPLAGDTIAPALTIDRNIIHYIHIMTLTWSMPQQRANKTFLLPTFILLCALPAFAQQTSLDDLEDRTPRLMLALSTANYPATPGDVYNLSYHTGITGGGATAISIPIVLDADYQLKIQNMGTINARNKTYLQVRQEVENLVSRNYPMSGPTLTLIRMGYFTVPVTGETISAGNRSVDQDVVNVENKVARRPVVTTVITIFAVTGNL
jgi:hypothetical protein